MSGPQKYFLDPFAIDGDRVAIPNAPPGDGSVSYDIGFGVKYQQDPATTGLDIPRNQFNQLMFDITNALQILQQHGFPDFITTADNGGVPFPYEKNATVRYLGVNYYSLIDTNTDTPPSVNWGIVAYNVQSFLPGDAVETYSSTLPSGWLWMDGKTIGSAASGGTARANADTSALFTVLWNSIPNSVLPIQDSAGAASTRGVSAAADFAANKRLPIPDKRGRVAAAADNLGGTAANVLNNFAQGGVNGTILGNFGGEANHALSSNENGVHSHSSGSMAVSGSGRVGIDDASGVGRDNYQPTYPVDTSSQTGTKFLLVGQRDIGPASYNLQYLTVLGSDFSLAGTTNTSGLGTAHNTVQPTIIANFRIKLQGDVMNPVANLVGQTSISTGTGNMSLNATQGRQTFNAGFPGNDVNNQFFYFISNPIANEWEVGSGYLLDASTLVRATVLDSSNAGSLVSFTSGSKSVNNDVPASYQALLVQPAYRLVTAAGAVTITSTDKTVEINKTVAAATVANVDPTAIPVGKFITIKDGKGDADVNNITITPASGTFDGQGTYVLRYPYQAITFYSNGTNLRGVA